MRKIKSGGHGPVRLADEASHPLDVEMRDFFGLSSRTLLSEGPLRVSLVGLAAGSILPRHQATGPTTIQVLRGALELCTGSLTTVLHPGEVLSLAAREEHEVRSRAGVLFLLTLVDPQDCRSGRCPACA